MTFDKESKRKLLITYQSTVSLKIIGLYTLGLKFLLCLNKEVFDFKKTSCGLGIYVYVDADVIYKSLCPVCLLSPHNQEGTLFSMVTYVLHPSWFWKIWAFCVLSMYLNLPPKRRSSISQTLVKIKLKVKWMVKVVKTRNSPHPLPTCIPSSVQLSTWKRFAYIYTFCEFSTNVFWTNQNLKFLKNVHFFYTHY